MDEYTTALTKQSKTKTARAKRRKVSSSFDDTLERLQRAFIETFELNTHYNLPKVYIQHPATGIQYELEDVADVKDLSVLVLNVLKALQHIERPLTNASAFELLRRKYWGKGEEWWKAIYKRGNTTVPRTLILSLCRFPVERTPGQ
ncbi:hypothetical protein V8E54_007831 [Elaphomyces granulatus]